MLYELWRRTVDREGDRWAVRELGSGREWTYRELDLAAQGHPVCGGSMLFPQGAGVEFLLTTLQGWRHGRVNCPLEIGQVPPTLGSAPAGCAHLKTTSATTGRARFIAFSADQLVADVEHIVATMGLRPDWPNLGLISLAHSYGFSNLVLPLLLRGIPLVLGGSALPEVLRHSAEACGEVTVPAVPALWRAWQQAGAITPNIRLAISAGAHLPLALETEVFNATGVKIHNFYGASECGGIAYDRSELPRTAETCAGQALRGVKVSIGESGCLGVRSAAVGQTYWPEPGAALREGWFEASDLAELRDGEIHLLGRSTDVINVAGRKVVPELIEQALLGYRGVDACLVFGVPASVETRGELIVVLLVSRVAPDLAALRRFLGDRLPSWQIPRAWCMVSDLERNVRGKLSRGEWRRRYLDGDRSIRKLD
jgi:acyl-CoA synthetase (AMP-forming)/AMP-acid ligase II